MALSNTHIIPEIKKLLKELEEEAEFVNDNAYAEGIEHCIEKIRRVLETA